MIKNPRDVLVASEFVSACAATARQNDFDLATVGAEMLKQGYALLSGLPLDVSDRAVGAMLLLYEQKYVDVPQSGATQ